MKTFVVPAIALALALPVLGSLPALTPSQASFEQRFLQSMIEHHTMAVEMAQVCVNTQNVRAELTSLCGQIIKSQTAEIQMMKNWLQSWYGVTHTARMFNGDMQNMRRLDALSGDTFSAEFMLEMITHHAMAVMQGAGCLERAYHRELLEMCSNMISSQAQEIRQMRIWLMDWYEITAVRGHGSHMQMGH